jgi:hypothetical protein
MENPVHAVLVVCSCENMRDYELAATSYDDGVVAEVSVLEENAGIFLVNTDCVLDGCAFSSPVDECCVLLSRLALYFDNKLCESREDLGAVMATLAVSQLLRELQALGSYQNAAK